MPMQVQRKYWWIIIYNSDKRNDVKRVSVELEQIKQVGNRPTDTILPPAYALREKLAFENGERTLDFPPDHRERMFLVSHVRHGVFTKSGIRIEHCNEEIEHDNRCHRLYLKVTAQAKGSIEDHSLGVWIDENGELQMGRD
jgi:hypothetical protein